MDISDKAIDKARELADQLNLRSEFLCENVLDVGSMFDRPFDIVFTSYGTITWLPDLDDWAKVVDECLKPGGEFVIVEFHPMMWSLDDEFKSLGYDYFNRQAHQEEESGTYADRDADIELTCYWWNHPLSEVTGALLRRGLVLRHFDEFDYSCYNCLPGMERIDDRKYRFAHLGDSIPYMYSMKWGKD